MAQNTTTDDESPEIDSVFEHTETGDRVTVVSHMLTKNPSDDRADPALKTPFVVERESDGEEIGFETPAEFYSEYEPVNETATLEDLRNKVPSIGFRVSSNNEGVNLYPDAPGAKYGVIEHKYEGFPARGVVLYDVVGYEIVDMDFEPHYDDATMEEEFERFEVEIREWLDNAAFSTDLSSADSNIYREARHTYVVEHSYEGERYTIKLETEKKRRVR